MTGQHEGRDLQGRIASAHGEQVAVLDAESVGHCRADQCTIVPSELGQRVWQLLHPRVVGITSIPHLGARTQQHLSTGNRLEGSDRLRDAGHCKRDGFSRKPRVGDHAFVQRVAPPRFEVGGARSGAPLFANELEAVGAVAIREQRVGARLLAQDCEELDRRDPSE